VTRFDCNASAHLDRGARDERYALKGKEIIAEVFAGMGDNGRAGAGIQ
jgi:hypothetical protein